MIFTDAEQEYLRTQPLGRLATIGPAGAPQNHPVTYRVDTATGTIDIGGPDLATSRKYRNVLADPRVSFVVDDMAAEPVGPGGQTGRGVEIRGVAEPARLAEPLLRGFTNDVLRIHPRRVVAWNIDGPGGNNRDVPAR
jgi:pyridoxamine 5'-phosphate oxidase family protein